MVKWISLLIIFFCPCFGQLPHMKDLHEEGKNIGKIKSSIALQNSKKNNANDFLPSDMQGQSFDSDEALEKIKSKESPKSESMDFLLNPNVQKNIKENKGFHKNENFLKNAENISSNAPGSFHEITEQEEIQTTQNKCNQSAEPFVFNVTKTLQITDTETCEKVCKGHEKLKIYSTEKKALESAKHYRKELQEDQTIKELHTHITGNNKIGYTVSLKWIHKPNSFNCDHFVMETIQKGTALESERWVYDNLDLVFLAQNPQSILVESICLDSNTTKNINGKDVTRKCWKEQLTYKYKFPMVRECNFLTNQNCEQIGQECIQTTPFGCALWELSFKCFSKILTKTTKLKLDVYENDESYEPNSSFGDVAMKLAIFDEAKKDLEKNKVFDASKVTVFNGKEMQCSKSVAEDVLYDCCFDYSGIAKQMGLAKCNSDEMALSEMREKGLCHYVGSYEEKALGLWKSRDEHVYCCFDSKLARVVQEEGREQLKQDWGKAKKPKCEGFSMQELAKINFSKLDVSEMFDDMPHKIPEGFQERLDAFQDRLETQIEQEEIKKEST